MTAMQSGEVVVAGAASVLGKIGTVPVGATLYVRCPCDASGYPFEKVSWRVKCDKAFTVTKYLAFAPANSVTLTLNGVLTTETIIINGLTYTGHTDTTTVATRTFSIAGDNDADAVALAGVINNAASGTLGIVAVASAGGVVTLTCTTATVLQAVTGTAAGHCVVASTTLTNLTKVDAAVADATAAGNATTAGTLFEQWVDGIPQVYLGITNNSGADAATVVVGATRF